ncbi:MAG TPA: serine/threonine-protein kinase [Pirellulaceae bacterium]|nr:serine/threonine-protein kinase [Pirellulaceae bacterium]
MNHPSEPDADARPKGSTNVQGGHRISMADTDALLPEQWLSGSLKYDDFQPLTEGGTATLETCVDKNLHRMVVYKKLHPHLQKNDIEVRRFLREARVTSMIPHPGTVPVYELGRDRQGNLFFTMKKLSGRDLREILQKLADDDAATAAEFTLPRLIDVLIAACQTMAYAHQEGVIHRDLKPANILVGQFGEVIVLDWGLAKVEGESTQLAEPIQSGKEKIRLELTRPGSRYGTPLYMSPEQARGTDLDGRTDVYNLSSILYEMLTLRTLISGQDLDEVLQAIMHQPVPRPREVVGKSRYIPSELEAICLKGLARDPQERYQTVDQLASDLIRYRSGERVSVVRYGLIDQFRRWRIRNQLALTVGVSAALGATAMWFILRWLG